MRFITGRAVHMSASFVGWMLGAIWSLLVGGVAVAYAAGHGIHRLSDAVSGGTLAFVELCALALGVITLFFGETLQQPPEIVEQLLYRTEHDVPR